MTSTDLVLPGTRTEVGIDLPPDLPFEEWGRALRMLGRAGSSFQWLLGDVLNYGAEHFRNYGEKYDEALESTGLSYSTLSNIAKVAARVGLAARRPNLSWSHHTEVAYMSSGEQDEWLARAEAEGWYRDEFRRQILKAQTNHVPKQIEIKTQRQKQMARAAKHRIDTLSGRCQAIAQGVDQLGVELAIAVSSPEEIRGWEESFRDAQRALRKLNKRVTGGTPP